MQPNANTNTAPNATIDMNDQSSVSAEAGRLRDQADSMDARLRELRGENDAASVRPSGAASAAGKSNAIKTVKKVVAWTLGVGVFALASTYLYSKLQAAGVDVPGEGLVDAVAG